MAAPQTVWYLAEGATHSGFDLWYLIQNPSLTTDAEVEVTYLRPAPLAPVVKTYRVAKSSRFNIWVNQEGAALASTDVSARVAVTNGVPVIVERAMYLSAGGQFWGAGHNSAAVAAPATEWFLAEGATGSYFDLFYLICNPGPTAATVAVTYLRPAPAAPVTKTYTVAAASRFNIYVDAEEVPAGSGQWPLANAEVSARLVSTNGVPVVVERAMWWPGPTAGTWAEGHNSPGMTASGVEWVVADGEQGGPRQVETYVLMANPTATAASVAVTVVFEDGTAPVTQTFTVGAYSRVTLTPPVHFAAQFPAGTHRRFGVVVTSTGATPVPIVVERASYATPVGGAPWAAGTNAAAMRMR